MDITHMIDSIRVGDLFTIDTPQLAQVAEAANTALFNRQLGDAWQRHIDPAGRHVLQVAMLPERALWTGVAYVRCMGMLKQPHSMEPLMAVMDVPLHLIATYPRTS